MRKEKQLLKQAIAKKLSEQKSFVLMQYFKLPANTANEFRREIRKHGGDVDVMRKRVLIKAAEDVGISLAKDALEGHIGLVVLGEDALQTTKAIVKFGKEKDQTIRVLCGHFDGNLYGAEDVERLSQLPDQNGMRAQLLATLEAPMSHLVGVVEAILASVPHCLENCVKKEE